MNTVVVFWDKLLGWLTRTYKLTDVLKTNEDIDVFWMTVICTFKLLTDYGNISYYEYKCFLTYRHRSVYFWSDHSLISRLNLPDLQAQLAWSPGSHSLSSRLTSPSLHYLSSRLTFDFHDKKFKFLSWCSLISRLILSDLQAYAFWSPCLTITLFSKRVWSIIFMTWLLNSQSHKDHNKESVVLPTPSFITGSTTECTGPCLV